MNKYVVILILLVAGIFFVHQAWATVDDPAPGGVGGRRNSVDTLEDVFGILFGSGNSTYDIDVPSDPNIPTPTTDPNATPTPTTDPNASPTPTSGTGNSLVYSSSNYPQHIVDHAEACLANKNTYIEVERITGLPAEIIAGIHATEPITPCSPTHSCVSGRAIGINEPDLNGNCTQADTGIGKPNPLPGGGCGFTNLLDSCVYGATHLIGKIDKIPETFEELVNALEDYNGEGNRNCGKAPYKFCPPKFEGYDHIYPMNKFIKYEGDIEHQEMYTIFCSDGKRCCPVGDDECVWPLRDKEGVLPHVSILSKYF